MKEAYDRVKEREAGELEQEWRLMKESLVGYASNVCGKRFLNDRRMDIREASERARNRNEWRMIVTQF